MRSFGVLLVLFAFVALSLASGRDDDYYRSYDDSKKVVYVEKESSYRRPSYRKVYEKEPEYKKVVYKYDKPEQKRVYVDVKVVKDQNKDVVYKYVEKKYEH